jgi:hypothetical protein
MERLFSTFIYYNSKYSVTAYPLNKNPVNNIYHFDTVLTSLRMIKKDELKLFKENQHLYSDLDYFRQIVLTLNHLIDYFYKNRSTKYRIIFRPIYWIFSAISKIVYHQLNLRVSRELEHR